MSLIIILLSNIFIGFIAYTELPIRISKYDLCFKTCSFIEEVPSYTNGYSLSDSYRNGSNFFEFCIFIIIMVK